MSSVVSFDGNDAVLMLVRISLPSGHGPRGAGSYLVDVDEARALVAAGAADAITPVTPQAGLADDGVVAATLELVDDVFPPAPPASETPPADIDPAIVDAAVVDVVADPVVEELKA